MRQQGGDRFFAALCHAMQRSCAAAVLLLALLISPSAQALSLAYEHNFGTVYADALQRGCAEPLDTLGLSANLIEIFQDRRVDAVELYDF